jgi:hypothetical protein
MLDTALGTLAANDATSEIWKKKKIMHQGKGFFSKKLFIYLFIYNNILFYFIFINIFYKFDLIINFRILVM